MIDRLKLLITSGNPLIAIDTREEDRAVKLVRQAAEQLRMELFEWSVTRGMRKTYETEGAVIVKPGKAQPVLECIADQTGKRAIFLLLDIAPHCKEPIVARQLRELNQQSNASIVMLNSESLPEGIRRLCVPLTLPLPDSAEIEKHVREIYRGIKATSLVEVSAEKFLQRDMEMLVQTLRGLTALEITRIVSAAILEDHALAPDDLPKIVEAKRNLLQSAGCLESIPINFNVEDIGGLGTLKKWLARRRGGMTKKARAFGLDNPRGMLLLGVQGCGKSLCAKITAADWNMPLLRMDPGVLYQKFIGESENRLREALEQAESMAPVILWIDEIEKAFASASSDSSDGGLSQRMFGTLLTWMQDHDSPIFMVATANNIAALPPELMRKGRFDEIFFVDLPTDAVRRQVWEIHIRRRKRDPKRFNLAKLASASEGFSGAEIEQAVVSAMYTAFAESKELDDELIVQEIAATRPLSRLMGEKIDQLRKWAHGRCVPAD